MKAANAALFSSIEKRFGVPPGPLVAIWGMETGVRQLHGQSAHHLGRRHARL